MQHAQQEMLELINRARRDPAAEAKRYGIELNEGLKRPELDDAPRPPLAFSTTLAEAAAAMARDQLATGTLSHTNSRGEELEERVAAVGYPYVVIAENLSVIASPQPIQPMSLIESLHEGLFVDVDCPERGHRRAILDRELVECGIAFASGIWPYKGQKLHALMHATVFGRRQRQPVQAVGVVYREANGDGRYSAGEGIAGATVELAGSRVETAAPGGWQIGVPRPGSYELRLTHPETGLVAERRIQVADDNVKQDYELGLGWLASMES